MGWKTFKERFQIKHNISVYNNILHIGSGFVHNLISINMNTGEVSKNTTFKGFIDEYPLLKNATKEDVLSALSEKDVFDKNIPVYSYNDNGITEHLCEELGYPNCTHDGELMYENVFFAKRSDAVKYAIENSQSIVDRISRKINKLQNELNELKNEKEHHEKRVQELSKEI